MNIYELVSDVRFVCAVGITAAGHWLLTRFRHRTLVAQAPRSVDAVEYRYRSQGHMKLIDSITDALEEGDKT